MYSSVAFENLIYTLFGLYVWELSQTFAVEWSILVTRTRPFKWPMVSTEFHDTTEFHANFIEYVLTGLSGEPTD